MVVKLHVLVAVAIAVVVDGADSHRSYNVQVRTLAVVLGAFLLLSCRSRISELLVIY